MSELPELLPEPESDIPAIALAAVVGVLVGVVIGGSKAVRRFFSDEKKEIDR
jgi:hypothetical protein